MSSSDETAYRVAYETALRRCQLVLGPRPAASRARVAVVLAIGMLMQAGNCDEGAAARTLARASARSDQALDEFAEGLVEVQNTRSR